MSGADWVIGRGLLGSAIAAGLDGEPFTSTVRWSDPEQSTHDLREGLERFVSTADGEWNIYWCAGRGVTSTPREALQVEAAVFENFLDTIAALPAEVRARGQVFLASSVAPLSRSALPS